MLLPLLIGEEAAVVTLLRAVGRFRLLKVGSLRLTRPCRKLGALPLRLLPPLLKKFLLEEEFLPLDMLDLLLVLVNSLLLMKAKFRHSSSMTRSFKSLL
jgi:hypothetical protein